MRSRYGIGIEDYEDLFEAQGGRCAICEEPAGEKPLDIDHVHGTRQVRGLLCRRCNYGLGFFRDNAVFLSRASEYLFDAEMDRKEEAS